MKTFCLRGWIGIFFPLEFSIFDLLGFIFYYHYYYYYFFGEEEIFIVEFDISFFLFLDSFPPSLRWDAICDGELRFRLMDRILREMYLKRGDRFFEILCDWI